MAFNPYIIYTYIFIYGIFVGLIYGHCLPLKALSKYCFASGAIWGSGSCPSYRSRTRWTVKGERNMAHLLNLETYRLEKNVLNYIKEGVECIEQ